MKTSKRVISLVLTAIMVMTSFVVAAPMLKVDTNAIVTSDGTAETVTQTQIVKDTTVYDTYAANYLNGAGYSTGIVIPGLDAAQDYVIQGMTYYPKRDWMLVTAYHNDATASSKVFALDAATGEFVAMFSFINIDGSVNMDHGGGIAISENNIYYSCGDKDRKIAYAPLSALENAPLGQHTRIQLVAEKDFVEIGSISSDSKTAYSAYVCYDEGVLWMGNFYDAGADLIGITIAAAEYNAPSNNTYNSMVFGYELKGSTSAEEWANLTGATGKDCQGSPSYAIGLNNALKDVQYAVVDNGKLYLSRSYGSGAGNSINFGFGETSFLTVADIDLSQPGTVPVTISTTGTGSLNKTVMAYDISNYDNFPMMPMSEGLCFVDDQLFITFEGASNKYLNESSGITSIGNCEKPVDVIWQLDPYQLMEIPVVEPEKSIYYERVDNLSEIKNGAEYIIVHESDEKDPITQEQILYALDSNGNFNGHKLSKSATDVVKGYNGMIGHPISDYDLNDTDGDGTPDILYLNDPDNDDVDNVRWAINNVNGSYRFTSTNLYFANCNNLYFNANQITMAPSNAAYLSQMQMLEAYDNNGVKNGGFWISNGGSNFLWCNDGTNADYNNKINSYYSSNSGTTAMYAGISEKPGTFHCDARNRVSGDAGNIIGGPIVTGAETCYEDSVFYIYKRVVDEVASTYESRVYTDLSAELQADGTYTVDLETYAISPNHYKYIGERPTDYIIVADTSSSMNNTGSTGFVEYNSSLGVSSMTIEDNTKDDNGKENSAGDTDVVVGYGFSNSGEDIYFKHAADGKYYKAYLGVRNVFKITNLWVTKVWNLNTQYYYLYYVADDGYYYCFTNQESTPSLKYTSAQFKAWVEGTNGVLQTASSSKSGNGDRRKEVLVTTTHYRFDDVSSDYTDDHTRIKTLREAANNLVDQIVAENSQNRIALVQFGGSNGFYNTSSSLSTSDYSNAFWSASNASGLKTIISGLSASKLTSNDGMELAYVNGIMSNSGAVYTGEDSNRNVVIIYFSDGVAGHDDQNDFTTAANNNIAKALTAKKAGAFIYTVNIGADGTSNNRNLYMEAISSKYAEAASMTDLGGQSVDGINYNLSVATTTMNNWVNFGEITLRETSANNAVGLDNLDANSYLREQFSEAFLFPADGSYNVKVELVPGVFDKIGRFTFEEDKATTNHNVTHTVDTANRTVTVTNYNYAEQYVARNRSTPGNKLRVTITGLVANEKAKIQNTSINDTATTGLFKNEAKLNANDAFKNLPTSYFNIPEYTYVLDYGIAMYDNDINGTLKSVSADLSAQRDANGNLAYKDVSSNGLVGITNSNLDLIYKSTPTNFADSGYCLIQRDDGTYDWFEIKVVPASNVLFEEDVIEKIIGTGVAWSSVGSPNNAYQTLTNNATDVYGFDSAYADGANSYSYGSAAKATVTTSSKRSVTKTFDFIGDGIDLISACGANTGIMIVKISGGDLASPKAYIVDTYYGDSAVGGMVYQTPIVSFRGNHGTYTVEATAAYLSSAGALQKAVKGSSLANGKLSATTAVPMNDADVAELLAQVGMEDIASADLEMVWFDDNSILNGGTGAVGNVKTNRAGDTTTSLDCYLDGFRTYNPLKNADDNYAESEKNAQYINVLDRLIEVDEQTGTPTLLDGIAYVAGQFKEDENGVKPTLSFANYQELGPQNELYLNSGNDGIVVKVALPNPNSKVQLGLRAVTGKAKVTVSSDAGAHSFEVNSATEMYYDISKCLSGSSPEATITIKSTEGLLAVNNIKLTGAGAVAVVEESDLEEAAMYMSADPVRANVVNGVVTPVADGDTTEPDNGNVNIPGSDVVNKAPSFVQELIAKLFEILSQIFSFLPVGEVM